MGGGYSKDGSGAATAEAGMLTHAPKHFFGKKHHQLHAFSVGKDELVAQLKRPSLQIINWADKKDALQSMSLVLSNKDDLADFTQFLKERYADENVAFYNEVEAYKERCHARGAQGEQALKEQFAEAKVIFDQYVTPGSPQQVNVSAKAVKEIKAQFKLKQATAFVFAKCASEIVAMMTSDMLRTFTEQQKRKKEFMGAAALLLNNPELRRQVTFVTGREPVSSVKDAGAPPAHMTGRGDVVKRRLCEFRSPLDLDATAACVKALDAAAKAVVAIDSRTNARLDRCSRAIQATARAGHEHWRAAWKADSTRNPTGRGIRVKHGENVDVAFDDLRSVANVAELFRAAELAVVCALRADLSRRQQMESTHEEWIDANEYARGSPYDVPFDALVKAQFEMHEDWLTTAKDQLDLCGFYEADAQPPDAAASSAAFFDLSALVVKPATTATTTARGASSNNKGAAERLGALVATLVCALAGHRRFREAWQADKKRNPTGCAECARHGENADRPFEALTRDANRLEALRLARAAVHLALQADLDEAARLQLFYAEWLKGNPFSETTPTTAHPATTTKLPRAFKQLGRGWLHAARCALCLPPPPPPDPPPPIFDLDAHAEAKHQSNHYSKAAGHAESKAHLTNNNNTNGPNHNSGRGAWSTPRTQVVSVTTTTTTTTANEEKD